MTLRRALLLFGLLVLGLPVRAQDRLLSPDAFLGYSLGARFTPHHRVMDYVAHVAAHAPGVRLEPYGETYEGRPLVLLYVTAPDNLDRLDVLRADNLRRAGLLEGAPSGAPAPAVVWLSYNVHGNEAVSTEAAMATLYELADPANERTQAWLENTVVILDPCVNPDGRERYVQWFAHTVGRVPNPRPEAREHYEPWPGGRFNHYYFDLNRDWAWATQVETQQRLARYNAWMPHVHVDFHEQYYNEPYYFAPAAEPMHDVVTPWQRTFQATIGQRNARYFDAAGWLYFTRQQFDLLYPGYGDTWPTFNGAIGMTYEQGGHSRAGLAIETDEGDTLTLADRILHHHTTGLATVETTAQHAGQVVEEFERFFRNARTAPGRYRTFVVKAAAAPDVRAALAAYLDGQGIAYGYAAQAYSARGFRYRAGDTGPVAVEPGDLVVGLDQPKATLAKVLFEPYTTLTDSLTYDITAWALPYVYGLDAAALEEALPEAAPAPPVALAPPLPEQPYAYLSGWQSVADLRFLADVLLAGVRLRYAVRPFEVEGRAYAPGTLILTRTGNEGMGDRFDTIVRAAAERHGQPLHAARTGFVARGADFGSADVPFVEAARVAVLAGAPVSPTALGEVWHFFDQQIGYPATLLDADRLRVADLYDYDVLILPNGAYGRVLTDERLTALREWIRSGGRLVAMERAVGFLAGKDGFGVKAKPGGGDTLDTLQARLLPYGERTRRAISGDVPGAVYRVVLDPTHPLALGYPDVYFTLKQGDAAFSFLKDGWNVGVVRAGAPESGFAGYRARKKIQDSLVFGVEEMGQGEVVYLVDNPLFRGFWEGGKLLFGNAVFLVGR